MSNRVVSIALAIIGLGSWYAPGFDGIFADPAAVSVGEGRIIGAIFLTGAAVVWFQRG